MRENSNGKTIVIVLASVLLFVGLIVLAYLFLGRAKEPGIVLPEVSAQSDSTGEKDEPPADSFDTLRADNVMDALAALTRAASYHQILKTTTVWEKGSGEKTVELFCSGGLVRANQSDGEKTKSFLTDGQSLYFWYSDDPTVKKLTLADGVTLAGLLGLPDYKKELAELEILDAAFLPADETAGERIYVRALLEAGIERQYWIDLESACLVRADLLERQQLTYQVQQQLMELVTPADSVFENVFQLPDGSEPFGH